MVDDCLRARHQLLVRTLLGKLAAPVSIICWGLKPLHYQDFSFIDDSPWRFGYLDAVDIPSVIATRARWGNRDVLGGS